MFAMGPWSMTDGLFFGLMDISPKRQSVLAWHLALMINFLSFKQPMVFSAGTT